MLERKRGSLFFAYGMTPGELNVLMENLNGEFAPAVAEPPGAARKAAWSCLRRAGWAGGV